jgi:hypothetical protein
VDEDASWSLSPKDLAALPQGLSASNSIKARLYRSEARINERLEFVVREDIRPIVLYPFSNEFADVSWVNALRHTVL